MHGPRHAASAVLAAASVATLSGCVGLIADKHTYQASSPPVRVNGADIRMQVKPEGTDGTNLALSAMVVSAAMATFDGPFRWRIEALSADASHQSLVVHRIHTRTATSKRSEWYPAEKLGKQAEFRAVKDPPGGSRAVYPVPGLLVVKPRDDGALEVTVDLTVRADHRSERKTVRFRMDPSQKRQDEFVFVPAEIISHIGKPMEDWDQSGWD